MTSPSPSTSEPARTDDASAREAGAPSSARAASAGPALATLLGWLFVGLATGASLQRLDPLAGGAPAAAHLALAVLHPIGLGAVAAALVAAARRARLARRSTAVAIVLSGTLVALPILPDDVTHFAARFAAVVPTWLTVGAFCASAGVGFLASMALGRAMRGRLGRWLACAIAAGGVFVEPTVYGGLYPAFHLLLVAFLATLVGSAMVGVRVPATLARGRRPVAAAAILAALGLGSYVVPASELVRFRLVRDGDVVAQFLRAPGDPIDEAEAEVIGASPWLRDRSRAPEVPPTPGPRFAERPVVVLITVDSMRYDMLDGPNARLASLPNMERLRREGVQFRNARAPGASTAYSLTALFASKYYSQMEWHSGGGWWKTFPRHDRSARFPTLLARRGIWTAGVVSVEWLSNAHGIVRGFEALDYDELRGKPWRLGESVSEALIARIHEVGERPAFLFGHFLDAHEPFNRGGARGSTRQRYAHELAMVDRFVGRVIAAIESDPALRDRTLVLLTSDHGEGFHEHGLGFHGNSLYEELLHVPLIAWSPHLEPREVDTLVSLVDIGPTVLDVFGLPTPGTYMGESLYPALVGRAFHPTRPVVAQVGAHRSLVTPDGLKVIRNVRKGTLEIYDLRRDPGERQNLVDAQNDAMRRSVTFLDAFFRIHRYRRPGYEEPFRRL